MIRLTQVMPSQQQAPMKMDLPPVLISLIRSVFRPMAAIAQMMKNLDSSLKGWKTAASTPDKVEIVVMMEAKTNKRIKKPHLCDLGQVQTKAQKDHGVLQDFLGGEGDARLKNGPGADDHGHDHTGENGKDGTADDWEGMTQKPAGDSQCQTNQKAGGFFSDFPWGISLFHFTFPLSDLIIIQKDDKIK